MQRYLIISVFVCFLLLDGCKKDPSSSNEKQGVNFNLLLRTKSQNVSGSGLNIITDYSYNNDGSLAEIKRVFTGSSSSVKKDMYYYNPDGKTDSIVFFDITNPLNPVQQDFYKTEFHYGVDGRMIYSLNRSLTSYNDSSIYTYLANAISERKLYRKPAGSNTYSLLATLHYLYDANSNLVNLSVDWTNPVGTKTCTYTYDSKPGSLPIREFENEMYGMWVKAFDNVYTGSNNPVSRRSSTPMDWDWSDLDIEYNYSDNNKVIYQKIMHTGTSAFYEVFYYYD